MSAGLLGMFIKVPTFLLIKDHKKQNKCPHLYRSVEHVKHSFLTNQDWPNQARVYVFFLKNNNDRKEILKINVYVKLQSLKVIVLKTFPSTPNEEVKKF